MKASMRAGQARTLRIFRKVHRTTGAILFVFFFFVSVTGLLLGWKKNTGGFLLADTHQGVSGNPADWLPLDSLTQIAKLHFVELISTTVEPVIDRVDVRPAKGMAKFIFAYRYWGIQLDCTTGQLLHLERRRADFTENIHDGSIIDVWLGTGGGFKLFYTTVMGIALLIFTITGFWLWYGPIRMRRESRGKSS